MPDDLYVLTIVSPSDIVDDSARSMAGGFEGFHGIKRLAPNAIDVELDSSAARLPKSALDELFAKFKMDYCLQPASTRQKKLLITDMDSTIITCECIDEIADQAGIKDEVSEITERAMRGELDFKAALRERVALLAGLSESSLQSVYEKIKFTPGARDLITAFRKSGGYAVLVSGGFTYFTNRIKDVLKFDSDSGNILEIKNGKLTGKVAEPILDKNSKLETLTATCQHLGIRPSQAVAIGDGANDIPMIQAAGLGVAYYGKPILRNAATASINYTDLRTVMHFLGLTS